MFYLNVLLQKILEKTCIYYNHTHVHAHTHKHTYTQRPFSFFKKLEITARTYWEFKPSQWKKS